MTEHNNRSRLFTENEMDQLLTSFYKAEVPQGLGNPPSSWPQLTQPSANSGRRTTVTVATAESPTLTRPTASRGIAVAVATLAACLLLILFSTVSSPTAPGTAVKSPEANSPLTTEQTLNVSEGGTSVSVDENDTSLQEIEQIDLTPQELPSKKNEPDKRD